jgi:hypothetical protein
LSSVSWLLSGNNESSPCFHSTKWRRWRMVGLRSEVKCKKLAKASSLPSASVSSSTNRAHTTFSLQDKRCRVKVRPCPWPCTALGTPRNGGGGGLCLCDQSVRNSKSSTHGQPRSLCKVTKTGLLGTGTSWILLKCLFGWSCFLVSVIESKICQRDRWHS